MPTSWSPALRREAERIAARGGDMQFDYRIGENAELASKLNRAIDLADEWSRDADRAEHFAGQGADDAKGVAEARTLGQAADRLRTTLATG